MEQVKRTSFYIGALARSHVWVDPTSRLHGHEDGRFYMLVPHAIV